MLKDPQMWFFIVITTFATYSDNAFIINYISGSYRVSYLSDKIPYLTTQPSLSSHSFPKDFSIEETSVTSATSSDRPTRLFLPFGVHRAPLLIFEIFKETFRAWLETEHVFGFFAGGDSSDLPLVTGDLARFRDKWIPLFSFFLLRSLSNRTLKGLTAV